MQHSHTKRRAKRIAQRFQILSLGALSILSSFVLGIQSAGEVQTISSSAATEVSLSGDMNGDLFVDVLDALFILECVNGNAVPSYDQLKADPNGDGILSTEDAIIILQNLASRS